MDSQHFLTRKAFVYGVPEGADKPPDGCEFDETLGAWRWGPQGQVLVKSTNPASPNPQTKKHDRETGEDQKGE